MLVLTRKRDEFITIGSDIVIRVIKTGNGNVKLGIDAPRNVRVMRGEIATVEADPAADLFDDVDHARMEECMLEAMLVQS